MQREKQRQTIHVRLVAARRRAHPDVAPAEVARLLGIHRATLHHWERDRIPSIPALRMLATAYGVPLAELVEGVR